MLSRSPCVASRWYKGSRSRRLPPVAAAVAVVVLCARAIPVAAYDNGAPQARLPALGWSSWEAFGPGAAHPVRDYCDANSVMAAADAFHEVGLYDAGYRSFHLDDCWSIKERNGSGYIQADPTRFPDGMTPVIEYVHGKNLTFGLYTSGGPTACMSSRAGSRGHWEQDAAAFASWGVDWVKMDWCGGSDVNGSYTNMSRALNQTGRPMGFNMCEWGEDSPWIWGDRVAQSWRISGDHAGTWVSTKGAIRKSASIARKYSGRPYGWNDLDMLQTGNGAQSGYDPTFPPPNMTLAESITEFSMWAIAASPLLVTTPIMNCTAEEASAAFAARQPSSQPLRARSTDADAPCSATLVRKISEAPCTSRVTFGCLGTNSTKKMWVRGCRGVFVCDGVDNVVCNEECKTYPTQPCNFTCACSGGGPSPPPPKPKPGPSPPNPPKTCVGTLNEVQKIILLNREAIAVNQDVTPQGAPVIDNDLTVWARNLTGGSVALALYNEDDVPRSIGVPSFELLGWSSTARATVRDLWTHTDNGTVVGHLGNVSVPPHSTILLRLTPI